MTCSGSAAEGLRPRLGADGSYSLFSPRFGEGFHGGMGALSEARAKFLAPAQLERFAPGQRLRVVDVGFGLGTNSAALREAAAERGLELEIWGLECDPQPLRLALAAPAFRRQWRESSLRWLEQLLAQGRAEGAALLWGDARRRLPELLNTRQLAGRCDLVLLDAFSPQRCPELWTVEFLGQLARLLQPRGRLLTYCCAAAVRRSLQLAELELASIQPPPGPAGSGGDAWSFGTAASPSSLADGGWCAGGPLRPLTPMEREHLATRAAEPYRDPGGQASAAEILAARQRAQATSDAASTSAWRRRWGLERPT
jgi:tRNA U34 5-methylaminomethyl-2-thiouridine-forming methyltransferase MnmC